MKRILQNHKGLHYGVHVFAIEKVSYNSHFFFIALKWLGVDLTSELEF